MNSAPADRFGEGKAIEVVCRDCHHASSVTRGSFARTFRCPRCGSEQPISEPESRAKDMPPRVTPPPVGPAGRGSGEGPEDIVLLDDVAAGPWSIPPVATTAAGDPATDTMSVQRSLAAGTQDTRARQVFDRMVREIGKIFVGQDELVLGSLVALFSSGHVLIESVPGTGQDAVRAHAGPRARLPVRPHPVHGRPDAVRHHRGTDLRHEDAGVPLPPRTGLHANSVGRRNQPLARQDPRRAAGDHAGVSRDGGRHEPPDRTPVPGAGHAEPDRVGRHLQPARSAAGPLHVQAGGRLSAGGGGGQRS